MKNRLIILFLVTISFFHLNSNIFAVCGNTELCVYNSTGHVVYVQLYPVSMIFNDALMYNLVARWRSTNSGSGNIMYDYLGGVGWWYSSGGQGYDKYFRWLLPEGPFVGFEPDWMGAPNSSANGSIGFGVYKLEIQHMNGGTIVDVDSCLIEYDYLVGGAMPGDLAIRIGQNSFTYQFVTVDDGEENPYPEIQIMVLPRKIGQLVKCDFV